MSNEKLPAWAFRFLKWFCPEHLYEEIEGDLIQKFERDTKKAGVQKAKRRLIWNTVRFFRPEIVFRNNLSIDLRPYMLTNYLVVAWRVMLRNKLFASIN